MHKRKSSQELTPEATVLDYARCKIKQIYEDTMKMNLSNMKSVIAFSNQYTRRIKKGSMGPVQYFYFSKLSDISSCRYTFDSP